MNTQRMQNGLPVVYEFCLVPLRLAATVVSVYYIFTGLVILHQGLFTKNFFVQSVTETSWSFLGNKYLCVLYKDLGKKGCPQNGVVSTEYKYFLMMVQLIEIIGFLILLLGIVNKNTKYLIIFVAVYSFTRSTDLITMIALLIMSWWSWCYNRIWGLCFFSIIFAFSVTMHVIILVTSLRLQMILEARGRAARDDINTDY